MLFDPDERYQDFRRADDAGIFGSLSKRRKYGLRISRYDDLTDKEKQIYCLVMHKLPVVDPVRRFMFAKITFAPSLKDIKGAIGNGTQNDFPGLRRALFEQETMIGLTLNHPVVYRNKKSSCIVGEYYQELIETGLDVAMSP